MAVGVGVVLPARYQDARLVAAGGLADVYWAVDALLERPVVVKVLGERLAADDAVRKRFTREALAAARLSGEPYVATIYDVGEIEGRPFVVMQYLPGGSVADVLRREGAQPAARGLRWLEETARALDRAHERGVVHGGLEPANLLLDAQERVRVADFGIASAAALAAPEQAQGDEAGAHADEYALAVVAFELLTGRRPLANGSAAAEGAGISRAVDGVFARALAEVPSDRFGSCSEFVARLKAALEEPEGARPRPPLARPQQRPAAQSRAGRRLLPLLGLVVLAAGGIGAAVAATQSGHRAAVAATRVTVTQAGTTVRETVTVRQPVAPAVSTTAPAATAAPPAATTAPPPPTTTAPQPTTTAPPATTTAVAAGPATAANGATLAEEGYRRLQAGDPAGALPLLQQAARKLDGTPTLDEAYNDYNLAVALHATSGCSTQVLQLLDASESIQGHRSEITHLRQTCTSSGR
ncbi:MAG TPA: serine/threonine-protein kinase [Gaiellaceae bacterium]|nr:serine/threonine-protein kinase [Gaiellaceae bacterium]